jgi:hypothetical protein
MTDWLDEEYPLGDGDADLSALIACPYCGEQIDLALDPGGGDEQQYVEDCAVCCRPLDIHVTYTNEGAAVVTARTLDE